MGILTDEPLIDDSELDDFDWDQHVTSGGNMNLTRQELFNLQREKQLFLVAHEMMHRLMEIEPDAVDQDFGEINATTDEGKFLARLILMITSMTVQCDCPDCTGQPIQ